MSEPRRGEVWWGEIEGIGRRPVLVMTRAAAIPVLNSVLAAPVTRTIRSIPTEVLLGHEDGMPTECAASFDNLRVVPKSYLVDRVCALSTRPACSRCAEHFVLRSTADAAIVVAMSSQRSTRSHGRRPQSDVRPTSTVPP